MRGAPSGVVAAGRLLCGLLVGSAGTGCAWGPTAPACDLDLDGVIGKTFVMREVQPDGRATPNPLARVTFVDQGGVKAKYTSMSLGDIYTYDCIRAFGPDGWSCVEPARLQDWCEALLAWDVPCTEAALRGLGAEGSDVALHVVVTEAKRSQEAALGSEDERTRRMWAARRANLGNKLQGQLFARVDAATCQLRIEDRYWTLHHGEKREDANPVGAYPFLPATEPWMFEHCDNQADLWDADQPELPVAPPATPPAHAPGRPVHYFHMAELGSRPEEGCTYSFDTWVGWQPGARDQAVTTNAEGRLVWHAEHTFSAEDVREVQGRSVGVFHMARFKTCQGKRERIDVACRATAL